LSGKPDPGSANDWVFGACDQAFNSTAEIVELRQVSS